MDPLRLRGACRELSGETRAAIDQMRADYERDLDARHAAARGQVDAIIAPEETRSVLGFLLRTTSHYGGPHLGPFVLPPLDAALPA